MEKKRSSLKRSQPRVGLTYLIFMLIQVAIYVLLSISSINVQSLGKEVSGILQQNSQSFSAVFLSIFLNNFKLATLEIIPALGILLFLIFTFTTGLAISSYSVETHAGPLAGLHLFLLPDTLIELSAYAVGAAVNLYILVRIIALRQLSYWKLKNVAYLYGFMVLILAIAALFETANIKYPLYMAKYFDIYWIFAVPAIIALVLLYWYCIRPRLSPDPQDTEELQYL